MHKSFSLLFLLCSILSATHTMAMTDEEMSQFADSKKHYRNVGSLSYVSPQNKEYFAGSAVYLSERAVVTAAHCVVPYQDNSEGQLYLNIQNNDANYDKYEIDQIKTLVDKGSLKQGSKEDIALLKLKKSISTLEKIEISKLIPLSKSFGYDKTHGGLIVAQIGYGFSGDHRSWFSSFDYKRRGIISKIYDTSGDLLNIDHIYTKPAGILEIDSYTYNANDFSRDGYSGGGAFTMSGELIGINHGGGVDPIIYNSLLGKLHTCYLFNIGFPLMNRGCPMPCMHYPARNYDNDILSLAPHREWIEKAMIEFENN